MHDQHPRSAAAPAAASAAGAGKGSPGGAAWTNLNKLLGAHHVPPELMQEIGLARVSCLVTLDSSMMLLKFLIFSFSGVSTKFPVSLQRAPKQAQSPLSIQLEIPTRRMQLHGGLKHMTLLW